MKQILKKICIVVVSVLTLGTLSNAAIADQAKKILMVISSNGKDGGKSAPGYEFDEFSHAYYIFKANGLNDILVSSLFFWFFKKELSDILSVVVFILFG